MSGRSGNKEVGRDPRVQADVGASNGHAADPARDTLIGMSMATMPVLATTGHIVAYSLPCLDFTTATLWSLSDVAWTIGRDPESAFLLSEHVASRLHGTITKDDLYRMHTYQDKGSTNGSAVNGLYTRRALLHTGDTIDVPGVRFYYYPDALDRHASIERHGLPLADAARLQCVGATAGLFTVVRLRNFSELANAFEFAPLRAISEHLTSTLAQLFPFSRIESFRNGFECILITSNSEQTSAIDSVSRSIDMLSVADIGNGRSVSLKIESSTSEVGSDDALAAITTKRTFKQRSASRSFNWIHLSDLHLGAGLDGWKMDHQKVLSAITHDLKKRSASMHFDRMFITGDISFKGSPEEFSQAVDTLRSLAAVCDISLGQVRVVPGNHDVQRALAGSPVVRALHMQARQQEELLDQYLSDERARATLQEKLSTFLSFVSSLPGHPKARDGLDWIEECPFGDHVIKIFGLCSVWISDSYDGKGPDRNSFFANLSLSPEAVAEISSHRRMNEATIILTHHPRSWLMPISRRLLGDAMTANGALHLCGHSHTLEYSKKDVAGGFANAVMNAGASHADPSEPPVHTYSWGSLKWDTTHQHWQAGWSPRIFVPRRGEMRPDGVTYNLDQDGFCWLPLPSREPSEPHPVPEFDPYHTLAGTKLNVGLEGILGHALGSRRRRE